MSSPISVVPVALWDGGNARMICGFENPTSLVEIEGESVAQVAVGFSFKPAGMAAPAACGAGWGRAHLVGPPSAFGPAGGCR